MTEQPGFQTRILDLTTAHDSIKAFLDDVDLPVVEFNIEFDLGIAPLKLGECRKEGVPDQRKSDPQPSLWDR